LHIAEVVAARGAGLGFRRLGVTGTRWLVDSEVYPERLTARGLEYVRPNTAEREEIHRIIVDELVYGERLEFSVADVRFHALACTSRAAQGLAGLSCSDVNKWLNAQPPLKSWGVPWLGRAALGRRDARVPGPRGGREPDARRTSAPPPPRWPPPAAPSLDLSELVAGYRAGMVEWNVARLGPPLGSLGCRVDAAVLRENGYCDPPHHEHLSPTTRLPTDARGWRSMVRISSVRLVPQPGQWTSGSRRNEILKGAPLSSTRQNRASEALDADEPTRSSVFP
jgi:hypothetical protein